MTLSRLFLCLSALTVVVFPSPLGPSSHIAQGTRNVPPGWSLHRRADPDVLIPLKFTLVQSNVHNLDSYLLDIADPSSPNYGQHWSPAKVADTFRPSEASVETVRLWMVDNQDIDPRKIQLNGKGDVIELNVTVAEAERLLNTEYYIYRSGEEGHERLGCHQGYSLPEHVSKHVDLVSPTVYLGRSHLQRRDGSVFNPPGFGRGSAVSKKVVKASRTLSRVSFVRTTG